MSGSPLLVAVLTWAGVLLGGAALVYLVAKRIAHAKADGVSNALIATAAFLVLLRVVIGWHFLFEAAEKFKTDTWSAEGYLREAAGPLAPAFRWLAGDPLRERLTPRPLPEGENPLNAPLHQRFPAALEPEWQAYFNAFVAHYQFDEGQRGDAERKFLQQKEQFVKWLEQDTKKVTWTSPFGPPVTADKTIPERLALLDEKVNEARKYQETDYAASVNTIFEDEAKAKLLTMKGEANRMRAELRGDLAGQTQKMKEVLLDVLTPEQKQREPLRPAEARPGIAAMSRLDWINESVRWGLLIVGVCLLLGLFSRPACVVGAAFLLMFYLAMPALPWLPEPPKVEGHYFFVNKNLIELVALLALATVPTGRWLGLDALLQFLLPSRWRTAPSKEYVAVEGLEEPLPVREAHKPAAVSPNPAHRLRGDHGA
jgi:uncharacterized membrane protein YphA (DoxX/SURF4 family)